MTLYSCIRVWLDLLVVIHYTPTITSAPFLDMTVSVVDEAVLDEIAAVVNCTPPILCTGCHGVWSFPFGQKVLDTYNRSPIYP